MTVRKNIGYPLQGPQAARAPTTKDWVEETAELVDCGTLLDRYPAQLSGGQQQRVALARGLVARPDVVLFDEPLSNLDARLRDQVRAQLHELHAAARRSRAVFVTHDQSEALALADRVAIMRAGRFEQIGTPSTSSRSRPPSTSPAFIGMSNRLPLVPARRRVGPRRRAGRPARSELPGDPHAGRRAPPARRPPPRPDAADLPAGCTSLRRRASSTSQFGGRHMDVVVEVERHPPPRQGAERPPSAAGRASSSSTRPVDRRLRPRQRRLLRRGRHAHRRPRRPRRADRGRSLTWRSPSTPRRRRAPAVRGCQRPPALPGSACSPSCRRSGYLVLHAARTGCSSSPSRTTPPATAPPSTQRAWPTRSRPRSAWPSARSPSPWCSARSWRGRRPGCHRSMRLLRVLPILPIVVPAVASVIGWSFLLSPRPGYLNALLRNLPWWDHLERGPGRRLHAAVDHHHHRLRAHRVRLPLRERRLRQHQLRAARGRPGQRLLAARRVLPGHPAAAAPGARVRRRRRAAARPRAVHRAAAARPQRRHHRADDARCTSSVVAVADRLRRRRRHRLAAAAVRRARRRRPEVASSATRPAS